MTVNYAVENLRFGAPVKVNSEVRLILTLEEIRDLRGITRVGFGVTMEIKGEPKPAYKGKVILLITSSSVRLIICRHRLRDLLSITMLAISGGCPRLILGFHPVSSSTSC